MSYQKDKPAPRDNASASQEDILNNFDAISDFINVDQVDFGDANEGKHKKVTYSKQTDSPSTASDEVALYCKDTDNKVSTLYFRPESDGDEVEVALGGDALLEPEGWSALPGGLLLKWGIISNFATRTGSKSYSFPEKNQKGEAIPPFTGTFIILLSTITKDHRFTGLELGYSALSNTGFTASITVGAYGTTNISYIVLDKI